MNPLARALATQQVLILDGGLATELENRGADISGDLWSAGLLIDRSELLREVHRAFLEAGADIIASTTYQASFAGFAGCGLTAEESEGLMRRGVDLAVAERDLFWSENAGLDRCVPLVAASVGPYGAYLADGSEYTGDYRIDDRGLDHFHRRRWEIFADSNADLLACETIPSAREALVLRELLRETPETAAWFSFSCRDGRHLRDGTLFQESVSALAGEPTVAAIGVNCVSPDDAGELVRIAADSCDKPIIVYPNSGEDWDARRRRWVGEGEREPMKKAALWVADGASIVGGCCRVSPAAIRQLRMTLLGTRDRDQVLNSR